MKRVALFAGLLCLLAPAAFSQAQPSLASGFGQISWGPHDATTTGSDGNLGIVKLGTDYYVSSAGFVDMNGVWQFTSDPTNGLFNTVFIFDKTGAPTGSFNQSATASDPNTTAWGYRDGSTDGTSLIFGFEGGVEIIDTTGAPAAGYLANNGLQSVNMIAGGALAAIGNLRGQAYDPAGDSGNGSFWSGNFGSDIIEYDQNGTVLTTLPADGVWSTYGLALDPVTGNLWVNSRPNAGDIAEIDPTTGMATGVSFQNSQPLTGVQGGLSQGLNGGGENGNFFDLIQFEQGSPDEFAAFRVHLYSTLNFRNEAQLLISAQDICGNPVPEGTADLPLPQFSGIQWRLGTQAGTSAPANHDQRPAATWMNIAFPPNTTVDGISVSVGGIQIQSFAEFKVLWAASAPTPAMAGNALLFLGPPKVDTSPLTFNSFPPNTFASYPGGAEIRAQGFYIDDTLNLFGTGPEVPPTFNGLPTLPVIATNQARWTVTPSSTFGLMVEAVGSNSFNADTSNGFWRVSHDGVNSNGLITDATVDLQPIAGPMVFDTDQGGMADTFNGGNSTLAGCAGTYRNMSDTVHALIYDGANTAPPTPCDAAANTGWIGAVQDARGLGLLDDFSVTTFRFANFFCGTFEWDADTDGGPGINGGAMSGAAVTLTTTLGGVKNGNLGPDPMGDPNRSVVSFP